MRPLILVRDLGRKFPRAWEALAGFRASRGTGDIPEWPDWCWCPLSGAYAVATGGSPDRLPSGSDVALLGALGAWRATQGIYRIHEALLDPLTETPLADVPAEWLYQLPEWCVYLEIGAGGAFAHLEWDANTARPELRFLACPPGRPPYPLIVHLDRPTIAEGIEAAWAEASRQAARHLVPAPALPADAARSLRRDAELFTALLVYLIGAVRDGDCRNAQGRPGQPRKRQATANHPEVWEIGYKQGAAFAAALAGQPQGGDHASPRPHVRRAHWHHFWEGPRDGARRLAVRWLPPILVGSGEIIPTVHTLTGDNR